MSWQGRKRWKKLFRFCTSFWSASVPSFSKKLKYGPAFFSLDVYSASTFEPRHIVQLYIPKLFDETFCELHWVFMGLQRWVLKNM